MFEAVVRANRFFREDIAPANMKQISRKERALDSVNGHGARENKSTKLARPRRRQRQVNAISSQ